MRTKALLWACQKRLQSCAESSWPRAIGLLRSTFVFKVSSEGVTGLRISLDPKDEERGGCPGKRRLAPSCKSMRVLQKHTVHKLAVKCIRKKRTDGLRCGYTGKWSRLTYAIPSNFSVCLKIFIIGYEKEMVDYETDSIFNLLLKCNWPKKPNNEKSSVFLVWDEW